MPGDEPSTGKGQAEDTHQISYNQSSVTTDTMASVGPPAGHEVQLAKPYTIAGPHPDLPNTWGTQSLPLVRTCETWTPRLRCTPEQSIQMRIPRLTLAHFGVWFPQSAHASLSGTLCKSFRRVILAFVFLRGGRAGLDWAGSAGSSGTS